MACQHQRQHLRLAAVTLSQAETLPSDIPAAGEKYNPRGTAAKRSGGTATGEEVGVFAGETTRHHPLY